ncbi:hypothetical protein M1512_03225 [Patescibacteria group bacterium]|nr:hypothetical protein [Patescibacteria group bacterium]
MSEIEKPDELRSEEAIEFFKRLSPDYESFIGKKIPGTEVNFEDFGKLCIGAEYFVRGFNKTEPGSLDEKIAKTALLQFGEHFKGILGLEEA